MAKNQFLLFTDSRMQQANVHHAWDFCICRSIKNTHQQGLVTCRDGTNEAREKNRVKLLISYQKSVDAINHQTQSVIDKHYSLYTPERIADCIRSKKTNEIFTKFMEIRQYVLIMSWHDD